MLCSYAYYQKFMIHWILWKLYPLNCLTRGKILILTTSDDLIPRRKIRLIPKTFLILSKSKFWLVQFWFLFQVIQIHLSFMHHRFSLTVFSKEYHQGAKRKDFQILQQDLSEKMPCLLECSRSTLGILPTYFKSKWYLILQR